MTRNRKYSGARRAAAPRGAWSFFAALAIALTSACSGGTTECAPVGSTVACTCTDGRAGTRTCSAMGTLGSCTCGGDAAVDAIDAAPVDAPAGDADGATSDGTDVRADDSPDVISATDAADVPMPGPGDVGAPCTRNSDCNSSLCLANGHCSQTCSTDSDCIAGWHCGPLPGVGNLCQCTVSAEICDTDDNDCDGVVNDHDPVCFNPGQVCQGTDCVCPPANSCGGRCVDLMNDRDNCGTCGHTCPSGVACVAGACNCGPGATDCGSLCVDVQHDRMNCGGCGTACSAITVCNAGSCVCPIPGQIVCGGACVDPQSDVRNCGACGTTCAAGGSCTSGACACPGTMGINCGGTCRDLASDTNDCGMCGHACQPGATCVGGSCACPGVMPATCSGACSDLASDGNNCGACGVVCPAGGSCSSGTCSCPSGFTTCGTTCANLANDPAHCGSCTIACPTGVCSGGMCVTPAPRLIAPLSTALTTSQRPTFHVLLATGTDGVRVQICADRACSMVEQMVDASGSALTPTTALTAGTHYWRAYGRIGSTTGTASTPVWEFRVGARSAPVDTSWGTIVDVNGDGYGDALVAAPTDTSGQGAVYVYHGSAVGVGTSPAITLAGRDGPGATFGSSVSGAGDVNGDGYADVIIGAQRAMSSTGRAYLFLGGPSGLASTPATTLTGMDGINTFFGGVTTLGDVDGDGYADVGVYTSPSAGTAYVYRGSATGLATTPVRAFGPASGGAASGMASAGDVNGDGFGDLIIPFSSGVDQGVRIYSGSASGLGATPSTTISIASSTTGSDIAGARSVDDTNGDGYADLSFTTSAPVATGTTSFTIYVWLGGTAISTTTPSRTYTFNVSSSVGTAGLPPAPGVTGAGDLNHDGYGDFCTSYVVGGFGGGHVYAYFGSPTGLSSTSTAIFGAAANYGVTLAGGSDLDRDGFTDLLVGQGGGVVVYSGSASGINTTPVRTITSTTYSFGNPIAE